MYMREAPANAPQVTVGGATRTGLAIAAVFTIAIGLIPPVTVAVIGAAEEAARALL